MGKNKKPPYIVIMGVDSYIVTDLKKAAELIGVHVNTLRNQFKVGVCVIGEVGNCYRDPTVVKSRRRSIG